MLWFIHCFVGDNNSVSCSYHNWGGVRGAMEDEKAAGADGGMIE